MAVHSYGCRVIQRILENCKDEEEVFISFKGNEYSLDGSNH
jgi:hypothetical protein